MDVGTIISSEFLPQARVLMASVAEHHPEARRVAVLTDDDAAVDAAREPFEVLRVGDLPLDNLGWRRRRYDVFEFANSLKAALLQLMLEHAATALFLDADMRLYAPLEGLDALLAGHGVVLTPHLLVPLPRDRLVPGELDLMQAGTLNGGFVGVGRGDTGTRFLRWWAERVRTECRVDLKRGLMVDQRWLDMVPSYFASAQLLRDPGVNVAYWNLPTRDLGFAEGRFTVDGGPLRLFHFSGFDPERPRTLSRHQTRVVVTPGTPLDALCQGYAQALIEAGSREVVRRRTANAYRHWVLRDARLAAERVRDQVRERRGG